MNFERKKPGYWYIYKENEFIGSISKVKADGRDIKQDTLSLITARPLYPEDITEISNFMKKQPQKQLFANADN